ncbi:hypothetical protein [Chitinivorax sp. B]|uniref:hypothetical protein n=1 Tax=Chitinivorax sp. B TaxID=2502235 RepID=UPI0010F53F90|nr:hypothetical protein [Chitinivorax sp. B]
MPAAPSFDAALPLNVSLRFFLTAPLFGMLAAIWFMMTGAEIMLSRWHPATLAWVHLLTLGFMLQTMVGAVLQLLPVVAGVRLPSPVRLTALIHGLLVIGTLTLAAAFYWPNGGLSILAWVSLLLAFAITLAMVGYGWRATGVRDDTAIAIAMAVLGLIVTIGLGSMLFGYRNGWWSLKWIGMTRLHVAWGLVGWTAMLVLGVAMTVVPMFIGARRLPVWLERLQAPILLLMLVLWSLVQSGWSGRLAQAMVALVMIGLAGRWLWAIAKSRRPIDVTRRFWQLGLLSFMFAAMVFSLSLPGLNPATEHWMLGVLLIDGFAISIICGMLYKIVPFLVWLHLTQASQRRFAVPNVKQLMRTTTVVWHWRLHLVCLMLLLIAPWLERWGRLIGLPLLAAHMLLGWNLYYPIRRYRSALLVIRLA